VKQMKQVYDFRTTPVGLLLVVVLVVIAAAETEAQLTIRPLSKNWYRVPYSDGSEVQINPTNVLLNGHNGYDLWALPFVGFPSPYRIVASAPGTVVSVQDGRNQCDTVSGCNSWIWIQHDNGEYSAYFHIAFGSAQVDSGDIVQAGDYLGDEGDVGSTTGPGSPNRPRLGCDGSPPSFGFCGVHLHFAVTTVKGNMDPSVSLNPRLCGVEDLGYVFVAGDTIHAAYVGNCDNSTCPADITILGSYIDTIEVVQSSTTITTAGGNIVIDNSVVGFQAQEGITLNPGFMH
jgi:hypothetical protein